MYFEVAGAAAYGHLDEVQTRLFAERNCKMLGISLVWAQKIDQRAKKKLEDLYLEGGGVL